MKITSFFEPFMLKSQEIFLVSSLRKYSYMEVYDVVGYIISLLLQHKLQVGSKVVVIMDHDEYAFFFLMAASALGLQVIMPYNLQEAALSEWVSIIKASSPHCILFLKKNLKLLPQLRATTKNILIVNHTSLLEQNNFSSSWPMQIQTPIQKFIILFTSGTTGNPKAICISEQLIYQQIIKVSSMLKFNKDSRIFLSGLMNNTTGILFSFGALHHKAKLFIPENRCVEYWPEKIEAWKITHIMLRPAAMRQFVVGAKKSNHNLTSLKVMAYGAASLPRKTLEAGRKLMPCEWIQGYGLSETFGPFCWLTEEDHNNMIYKKFFYCLGKSDETLQITLDLEHSSDYQVGEVLLKGIALMEGYYDIYTGKLQKKEEWFRTGDYAELSENGYLVLKGRMANTVLTKNGHRLYPEEVEACFRKIEIIDEAILLANRFLNNGEADIIICISGETLNKKPPQSIRNLILAHLQEDLSQEKWPEYFYISAKPFAKGPNDKVLRSELLKLIKPSDLIPLSMLEEQA